MQWLKQSTAATVELGPVADAGDGVSEETGLAAGSPTPIVHVSKNGGGFAARNGSSFTHDGFGWYLVGLSATDTDTSGRLTVMMRDPVTHLPVWAAFMVLPANAWDSLFGSDRLQVDVREYGDANLALTTQMKADVNAEADTAVAAILEDTGTSLPATLAGIEGKIDTIDGIVDGILLDTAEIGAAGAGLSAIPWNAAWNAEVQGRCADALVAIHLDHIFAAAYDPAAKPGNATALLNELVESDAGVSRFTANALEQAPAAAGGLSQQDVRDAMKLAPSAGAPAAGSLDQQIDDIEGYVDNEVTEILVDTGTTLANQLATVDGKIDGLNDISVNDILTTQMTESYAADGVTPTLAQAVFQVMQQAGEFSISGTTITVKKLDSTTPAMTFTLDDASNPTSRHRAS